MKSQTNSFFQYLIEIIIHFDCAILKNYAFVLLAEMVRANLIDSLLDIVQSVCWDAWDNQDTRNLAQICSAEALVVDCQRGGLAFMRLLETHCFKSLTVFKVFSEITQIIKPDILEIAIRVLKDCLNSDEFVLISVQCLKNCEKFLKDKRMVEELGMIMSQLCVHFNERVRFECLDELLEICEGYGEVYIETKGVIKILSEDSCQNKWIATCILNFQQVQINPEIFSYILKNLYENELWEISIEYLTTAVRLEICEEYLKYLIFSYKNEPVVFLAIMSSLPKWFYIDREIASIFFLYFFTDCMKLKEKAVFVLSFNQAFTKSIVNTRIYSELINIISYKDYSESIKISASWAIYNTLEKKLTQIQCEFFINQFLQLKGSQELMSVAYLIINQLLPMCSQSSINAKFLPLFLHQYFKESNNFSSYCILNILTNSLSLLYPNYSLPESLIRELLKLFLAGEKSDYKLHFLETLSSLYPLTYSKFEVLISLYLQKQ